MSSLFGIGANGADASFYNGVATQSLRFDGGAKLTRTPSSSGNQKKWTSSFWVKRSKLGTTQYIWSGGSYSGNDGIAAIYFGSDDKITTYFDTSGSNPYGAVNGRLYRDTSAWYHIVWAVDAENTVQKIWVNGVEESLSSSLNPPNYDYGMNRSGTTQAFGIAAWGGSPNLDGYLAEITHLDGQYLDETYFGEFKNGVWIAKDTSDLTFGTNGFILKLDQTGTGTGASDTVGADTSGNTNHFTSSGIVASDCAMPDSPENNFCTLNSIGRRYGQSYVGTFTEGNLKVASGGNATNVFGTMAINQIASQGGVYFEVRMDSIDTARTYFGVVGDNGANNKNAAANAGGYTFPIKGMVSREPRGHFGTNTDGSSTDLRTGNTAFSDGEVIGIAILSDGKFFAHREGTYLKDASGNVGNPSTGANPLATIDLTLGDWVPYLGYASSYSVNFGQDGSFQGNETSGGNQDGNGIGDFMFAVPTNCLAICSSNMAEPTIGPNSTTQADDYFNTVLYTGNGSAATHTVGFRPNLVWGKKRNAAQNHWLINDVGDVGKWLSSDGTGSEGSEASGTTFNANGSFTTASNDLFYNNGGNYVVWAWKGNGTGTAVSNSDGSITSTVSANTTSGYSIVTYTGNGTNSSDITIGHSLGVTPRMVIVKNRTDATRWQVYHEDLSADGSYTKKNIVLNSTGAESGMSSQIKAVSSTTFTVRDSDANGNANVNKNNSNYVAYCFADVEGYSKFGSYTGNGSTDGAFVFTGFRPAFIMSKKSSGTGNWEMFDTTRDPINYSGKYILANSRDGEGDAGTNTAGHIFDILSNGFKLRNTNSDRNSSGGTYIYMAFAEATFKYANAR